MYYITKSVNGQTVYLQHMSNVRPAWTSKTEVAQTFSLNEATRIAGELLSVTGITHEVTKAE